MRSKLILLLPLLMVAGCSRGPDVTGPNVLLVMFDTVRADHFGCYGDPKAVTPNADRLAHEGVLFEQCSATVPLTLPSHASVLSSLYPYHHGARLNAHVFADPRDTLTEVLANQGYDTAAFVSTYVLHSKYGLARGFDVYDDDVRDLEGGLIIDERPADETTERVLAWLAGKRKRPFFLWVHYFDPHQPLTPPASWAARLPDDLYAAEIGFADEQLGRILSAVDLDNTLVVVAGDHGEALGQHGEDTHGLFVYEATLRVPLVIRYPGGANGGVRIKEPVSLVDVAPTVLDALGMQGLDEADGVSLFDPDRLKDLDRDLYFETVQPLVSGWAPLAGVRNGRWKYIHAPRSELYDLNADPDETDDLFGAESERAEDLALRFDALAPFETLGRDAGDIQVSARDQRILESLGYTGGHIEAVEDFSALPDPKDRIDCFKAFHASRAMVALGHFEDAERTIREAMRDCPEMPNAAPQLVSVLCEKGDIDRAAQEADAILEDDPGNLIVWDLAAACNRTGRPDLAIKYCLEGLKYHPEEDVLHDQLGLAFRLKGDLDKAIEHGRRAVELVANRPGYLNNLGAAYSMAGRHAEARRLLEQAVAIQPEFSQAWFNLGVLDLRMERNGEAVKHFRRAIDADVGNVDAWVQLNKALLYVNQPDEALKVSDELKRLRPGAPGNDYFMSVAYRQKAMYDEAEHSLRAFLARRPDFEAGYGELCEILLSKNPADLVAARAVAEEARARGYALPESVSDRLTTGAR